MSPEDTLKALKEGKEVPCPYCMAQHFIERVFECGTEAHYVRSKTLGFRRSENCYERQILALNEEIEKLKFYM